MQADLQPQEPAAVAPAMYSALGKGFAPRKATKVSGWCDDNRSLSSKGSAEPGRWSTARNPPTREPMDCFSTGSTVHEVALMWPIQFAKTEVALNVVAYNMVENPGPIMVALPGEVTLNKWVAQKLQPMIDGCEAVQETLVSQASREAANTRTFKDFTGGQLYIEHAGSPSRMKSTSTRLLVVDEFDEFAANYTSGDDPAMMLDGRTSAFPGTYQRLYISSPQIKGQSRIEAKWLASDQRRYHVACPHCGARQHLEWSGLKWSDTRHPEHGRHVWYLCRENGCVIEEFEKTEMIATGAWVPGNPGALIRGYHVNCLYYQFGLGPRWAELVEMWLDAQNDPAKLKVFVNDRLAEVWEDETTRRVKHNAIADRAETYNLRTAPEGVLCITAGGDTQDNRLAVHITGWGRGMAWWALDYVELEGDPAGDAVWLALSALLTRPILHVSGVPMHIEAIAQDAGGHRTEDVKAYVRGARAQGVRRPLCIFGAVPNNAPILSKGKQVDVSWRGKTDRRGIQIHHVGTVAAKHWLFSRLSLDADRDAEHLQALQAEETLARAQGRATQPVDAAQRLCHFSKDLPDMYFPGLTSEVYNPAKNRYDKKRGTRNEPLDTWVYSYAAAHHPELRLHRATALDWDRREAELKQRIAEHRSGSTLLLPDASSAMNHPAPAIQAAADPAAQPTSTVANGQISLSGFRRFGGNTGGRG